MADPSKIVRKGRRSRSFRSWLDSRMPDESAISLHRKNIFILPTRQGLYFAILIVFMMLAGINYQNSLIFALSFLLISMFMVSSLHTYRNLSGLRIQAGHTKSAFAGEDAEFSVILSRSGKRTYEAVVLGWNLDRMQGTDLITDEKSWVKLFVQTEQRGILDPGRLLIQTYYPVGLFRAWSWVDLNMSSIVYPRPLAAGAVPEAISAADEGELLRRQGVEDFHELRAYQKGDALGHVAWKSYARTNDLLVKDFTTYFDRRVWLDWDQFDDKHREERLSRLCDWVLQLSRTTDEFGLRIPGVLIKPANSLEHKERILGELAMFEIDKLK